ncbi:MAG: hypothetical protein QGH60_22180 [Phycisphaerae bacterium]|jgi:hypothetical protein|nr:hypothetical protein [Phycisphaerae bacterium]
MKSIKYAILLLVALMVFSSAVEAKKIVTVRRVGSGSRSRRREKERREKQLRERRAKAIKAQKKYNEQKAAYYKKKRAEANAREKEKADKARDAILAREKKIAADKKTVREENSLLGKYATMVTEARMSSSQRARLIAILKKQQGGKTTAGSSDNAAEIARLTKAYNKATGKKRGIIASALRDARKKGARAAAVDVGGGGSKADIHKQIMGLLTPAQKLKWGGYQLVKDPAMQFEGITLTAKQIKRIRAICDAASKGLPGESSDLTPKAAARARKSVLRTARSQIIFEVLTPEQRTIVQRADAKKRAAAAAAVAASTAASE